LFFTCLSLLVCFLLAGSRASSRCVSSASKLHLRLLFARHLLQEVSHLRNSELAARELNRRLLFGRHFFQEESHLQNSELSASTGVPSSLAFRPAFPPGRITAPEFRALCKHGSSISACFSACISSRKNHISGIPSFCKHGNSISACFSAGISSRQNHISGIPSFLQARELHLRLLFGRHFLQEASHLQNSKLTASTATLSRLLVSCGNLNIYANEVWYIQSTISNCFPYQTWGFFLQSILQCCQR
jgi:hypothetical protein